MLRMIVLFVFLAILSTLSELGNNPVDVEPPTSTLELDVTDSDTHTPSSERLTGTPLSSVTSTLTPSTTWTSIPSATQRQTITPSLTPILIHTATSTPGDSFAACPLEIPDWQQVYTIRRGDTLSGLAVRTGTTVNELKSANNLCSSVIYEGNSLLVPQLPVDPPPSATNTQGIDPPPPATDTQGIDPPPSATDTQGIDPSPPPPNTPMPTDPPKATNTPMPTDPPPSPTACPLLGPDCS